MARRRCPGGAGHNRRRICANHGSDPARTYIQARAAAMSGDHARAAHLLASLAQSDPAQVEIARKALSEAIGAGQMDLALSLAHSVPATRLPSDARLLLVGDAIKRGRPEQASSWLTASGDNGDLTFLAPLIAAWSAADRGNPEQALASIDAIPANSLLGPVSAEERAFILLKSGAAPKRSPGAASGGSRRRREQRLRLCLCRRLSRGRRYDTCTDDRRWDGR
jgi:hypothetical protein